MSGRVLVVDDSSTLRKLVEIAMRGTGADLDFAADGSDGVRRARAGQPDVILLDYVLPDVASTEVCRQLADDRATAGIPVVVMSASPPTILHAFRRFPAVVDFVAKPFTADDIRGRLEAAMRAGGAARGDPAAEAPRPATAAAPPEASPGPAPAGGLQVAGDLMTASLLDVLRLLANAGVTGELAVHTRDVHRVYLRRGEVLLCTSSRVAREELEAPGLGEVPEELLARARAEQARTGKPALVTLAEAGRARTTDLPARLHAASGALLAALLEARAGTFAWSAAATLPDYVVAFGRHLSVTQIAIAVARRAEVAPRPPELLLDEVYDRTPRFSEKLAGARLLAAEQRLLAQVDGRSTLREILARVEMPTDRAAALVARLRDVDLIRSEAVSRIGDESGGVIAVLDDDEAGFVEALRDRLGRRAPPVELVALPPDDVGGALQATRPRLVLLDARRLTPELAGRELAAAGQAGARLVAVLDEPDPPGVERLLGLGVHAVLLKPIHVNELERLLSL